jgi:AcrR family transcriptional regulator
LAPHLLPPPSASPVRVRQPAPRRAAILDAAWDRFARSGPDGTALRDVAADAGCTHALVARYFGSKEGLVDAVGDRLLAGVVRAVDDRVVGAPDPALALLRLGRAHRPSAQLLVRCALGDLQPQGFPACLRPEWILASTRARSTTHGTRADRRARLCAYGAASLLFGWLTFEEFLVAATRLGRVGARRRDLAIAAAASSLMNLAASPQPTLAARDLSHLSAAPQPPGPAPPSAGQALLQSAIELFAESGPASVSVRDIARHAGVNQTLIYRHFGSKQGLLTEAIEVGSADLFPATRSDSGFDFDAMSQLMHHGSPAPRLVARTLVDGIDITTVRTQFPILWSLLDRFEPVPTGTGPLDHSDPRVAVAAAAGMALGSVVWGEHLRPGLGLSEHDGHEAALADLARTLIAAPRRVDDDHGRPR